MDHESQNPQDRHDDRSRRSGPIERPASTLPIPGLSPEGRFASRGLYGAVDLIEAGTGLVNPKDRLVRSLIDLHKECVRLGVLLVCLGDEEGAKRVEHALSCIPELNTGYPDIDPEDLAAFESEHTHTWSYQDIIDREA